MLPHLGNCTWPTRNAAWPMNVLSAVRIRRPLSETLRSSFVAPPPITPLSLRKWPFPPTLTDTNVPPSVIGKEISSVPTAPLAVVMLVVTETGDVPPRRKVPLPAVLFVKLIVPTLVTASLTDDV